MPTVRLPKYAIEFAPPCAGVDDPGEFNTFRLGGAWAGRIYKDARVFLFNSKTHEVFGYAKVKRVLVGKLGDMATLHAHLNHNQLGQDASGAPQRLKDALFRRYGPKALDENRTVTVIYLERIE